MTNIFHIMPWDLLQECFQMVQFTSFMLHELKLKILVAIISATTIFFRLKHNIPFSSRTSRYYYVTIITIYYYYCYYYITGYNITMTPQNLRDLQLLWKFCSGMSSSVRFPEIFKNLHLALPKDVWHFQMWRKITKNCLLWLLPFCLTRNHPRELVAC